MDKTTKKNIIKDIHRLDSTPSELGPIDAEKVLMGVLTPLMKQEGYFIRPAPAGQQNRLDFIARRPQDEQHEEHAIGIEYKHYKPGRPIGTTVIHHLIRQASGYELDRVMLLANTQFSYSARELARKMAPLDIELIDLDALKAWVARINIDDRIDQSEVDQIINVMSRKLAQLIAEDPTNLEKLEWRDLERTLSEVFDGLGFTVTLTPGSKDSGKDIILECIVKGKRQIYIVEIKHWRCGKRVGQSAAKSFLNVIVREGRDAGLFLATYGYCNNAFESLTEIQRSKMKFGNRGKVVSLCKTYVRAESGIWSPPESLSTMLFEETF